MWVFGNGLTSGNDASGHYRGDLIIEILHIQTEAHGLDECKTDVLHTIDVEKS